MEFLELQPRRHVSGSVRLPGSKSISNRTLLLAALSNATQTEGVTKIRDLLVSDDTSRMVDALRKLGVRLEKLNDTDWDVYGCAGDLPEKGSPENPVDLFLGNAGTAFRPLTAALALSNGYYYLHGVPRMHERPIGDLVDALRRIGCRIEYKGNTGFPPLLISPADLDLSKPIQIRGDVSSQFLTALLMALPLTGEAATIKVVGELISKPYIEITLNLMEKFDKVVKRENWQKFHIPAREIAYISPLEGVVDVEGDASSASYFLAAGAIAGSVEVIGVGKNSIQGDIKFLDAIQLMGAQIGLPGFTAVRAAKPDSNQLQAIDLDCNHIPDAAMTLAVMALFAKGGERTTTLRNIASWRVKETDRIAAMATELRKLGATVEEGVDYIRITPPDQLTPNAVIDTYDDHRMAMCFSLVCLGEGGVAVTINDPGCVAKTFPDYFEQFARIVHEQGRGDSGSHPHGA